MIRWRQAEAEDTPGLKSFACYEAPTWAPNTSWQVKNKHHSWVRRIETLVRQLEPPVHPREHMLLHNSDDEAAVDGILYAGTPRLNAQGELRVTVYIMARSVSARGLGVGSSALEQLEAIALEVAEGFPHVEQIFFCAVVHLRNEPCRTLLSNHDWWEGEPTDDPEYSEWWFSIAFEDEGV